MASVCDFDQMLELEGQIAANSVPENEAFSPNIGLEHMTLAEVGGLNPFRLVSKYICLNSSWAQLT